LNWFKIAIDPNWINKGFNHFINIMKFEIENFPRLQILPDRDKENINEYRIGFYILRDDNQEYYFRLQREKNRVRSVITSKPTRHIFSNEYDISVSTPYQIIEEGLLSINKDISEDNSNELV
jgi:hypothetical protein